MTSKTARAAGSNSSPGMAGLNQPTVTPVNNIPPWDRPWIVITPAGELENGVKKGSLPKSSKVQAVLEKAGLSQLTVTNNTAFGVGVV